MSNVRLSLFVLGLLAALPLMSCGDESSSGKGAVHVDLTGDPPKNLSAYRLFTWDPGKGFTFNEGVVPYDLTTPLFSDYALKQRAIYVPPGTHFDYERADPYDLPVGSVVLKNFYFAADFRAPTENLTLIETRLLVRHESGWRALPYVWNEAQTEATLTYGGGVRSVDFIDPEGLERTATYLIPQRNQCASCHDKLVAPGSAVSALSLIGVKSRYLNRDYDFGGEIGVRNQLTHFAELGILEGLPELDTVEHAFDFALVERDGVEAVPAEDVEFAARTYLDINCAHCHSNVGVQGVTSQLFLNYDNVDQHRLGICKRPGSAGLGTGGVTYDIVPGNPDESILYFRTHTEEVGAMMPLLGRSVTHTRGAELVHAWISAMPAQSCTSP